MGKSFNDIKTTYILLDFNNQVWRSFHATKKERMTNSDNINTGCILGLCRIIRQALTQAKTDFTQTQLVICEDRKPTRKIQLYEKWQKLAFKEYDGEIKYKGNRDKEDLGYNPVEICQQFMKCLRHTTIWMDGEEADDVMASFVERYKNDRVIIYSTDKDMWQLIDRYPKLQINLGDNEGVTDELMMKHFETTDRSKIPLHKTIRGDSGDNVKSVKNFPFKKTLQAWNECDNTIENYFHKLISIYGEEHPAVKKIFDNIPLIILNSKLVTLKTDIKYSMDSILKSDSTMWNKLCAIYETPSIYNSPLLNIF